MKNLFSIVTIAISYLLIVFILRLLIPEKQDILFNISFTVFSYFTLVWILNKVLFTKIHAILTEREKRINKAITEAEQREKEASALKEKLLQEQKNCQLKVQQMTEEAARHCERMREEMLREVKEEIQQLRLAAREDIERERKLAWEQFRQKILSLAMLLAQRALRENLTDEDHQRYNETLLDLLEQQNIGDKI